MTKQNQPPTLSRRTLCAAALGAGLFIAGPAPARKARPKAAARAASTPSTAQILAPSQATVPDALPVERSIYRCGNSYSPRPCGDAKPLDVADARTDAQRRQADELAVRDRRLAQWLEAGRRAREATASAPARARAGQAQCVDTATMVCRPRKPRPRHAASKAASAATSAARLSPS